MGSRAVLARVHPAVLDTASSHADRPKVTPMHNHFDCRHGDPHPSLPMISGPRWFDDDDAPFRLQIELPLTFEEMVAALYNVVELADIASDEDLRGSVAVTVLIDGLTALMARVSKIRQDEQRHTIESPDFLAHCRVRVAELLGR